MDLRVLRLIRDNYFFISKHTACQKDESKRGRMCGVWKILFPMWSRGLQFCFPKSFKERAICAVDNIWIRGVSPDMQGGITLFTKKFHLELNLNLDSQTHLDGPGKYLNNPLQEIFFNLFNFWSVLKKILNG